MKASERMGTGQKEGLVSPFCRHTELAGIRGALDSSACRAVFVASDSGLGTSTLLRRVKRELDKAAPVLLMHGSASLANIDFGVLSAYVGATGSTKGKRRLNMLRSVMSELERPSPESRHDNEEAGRNPIIIVDDGHSLDEGTTELLTQLAMTGTAKLVVSYSKRIGLPDPLTQLWIRGAAETIAILPLDQEEGHRFCSEILRGSVLPATSWHYWSLAAGNPLFMKMMLRDDVERGILRQHNDNWVSEQGAHFHSRDLQESVKADLHGLSEAGQDALNLLALAEPLAESTFEQLVSPKVLRELQEWPLIQQINREPVLLALAIPIYGEVIREIVPVAKSRRLYDMLNSYVGRDPANHQSYLRRVMWSLEMGMKVSDQGMLKAAVLACKLYQSRTALDLAERIDDRKYELRVAMVKARAQYNLGEYKQALELMLTPVHEAETLEELLFGSLLRASTRLALGMSVEAVMADAQELRSAGDRLEAEAEPAGGGIREQTYGIAAVVDLMALSRVGHYSKMAKQAAKVIEQQTAMTGSSRLSRAFALSMDSERLTAQGLTLQGFTRAEQAFAIEHSEDDDVFFLPESIMQRQLTAVLCAGEWGQAAGILERFSVDAGPMASSFGGSSSVVRGMVLIRANYFGQARAELKTGIEQLSQSDPQQLQGFCTAMACYAVAQMGLLEEAVRLITGYVESTGMFIVLAHERAYLAATRHLLQKNQLMQDEADGLEELMRQADDAHAEGSFMIELNALALLLELGVEDVALRVSLLAGKVEGRWAEGLGAFAQALHHRNGAELMRAADTLEGSGMFGFAKLAWCSAARFLATDGQATYALTARSRLRNMRAHLAVKNDSAPSLGARKKLTPREHEIVTLAVAGLSDKMIADQLKLSTRTIEGHLYRTYSKLGISGRDGLGGALVGDNSAGKLST